MIEDTTTDETPTPEAETPTATDMAADGRLAELEGQNAEMRDQLLRTLAEMENLRRRTEREVKDASQYAIAGFARSMLTVGDNLRRGLDAVPAEARERADAVLTALLEGVEMTEREMLNQLEKHGVRRISPEGEKFDPHFHQAMFEVPDAERPAGTVVQVLQPGYVIGERVLRPALVGVAKGGAKPASGTNAPAADAARPGEAGSAEAGAAQPGEAPQRVDRSV